MASRRNSGYSDLDDLDDLDTIDLDELITQFDLDALAAQLPPGAVPDQVLRAMLAYSDTAAFLDEETIKALCNAKALSKGKKLVADGQVMQRSFNGETAEGVAMDGSAEYHPSFDFDLTSFGCDCPEPSNHQGCSHIAALMWAWKLDMHSSGMPVSFLPAHPSAAHATALMKLPFGKYLSALTGETVYERAVTKMKDIQLGQAGAPANSPNGKGTPTGVQAGIQTNASTGVAHWPLATSLRVSPPPLHETLEAEFNTAQLRELARLLNVKLKGTSKSGFVEQVMEALNARVAGMRENPDLLLEGLVEDQAMFVRRALTARDHDLPLPRNLASTLWAQQVNKDPDKRLADVLETLRRRAVLFPTRTYFGYRDVYYQWRPLDSSGGNVPLMTWPLGAVTSGAAITAKDGPKQALVSAIAPAPANFLDDFELFINAMLSTGSEVRASLPPHAKAAGTVWLKDWEHDAGEAERLLNSRPGWVPNPQSGISIPLLSPLTPEACTRLENQTGLPAAQGEFLFAIACALQLIEAPDPLETGSKLKGAFNPLASTWRVGARASAIEEWFALSDEDKFLRAWNAWGNQMFFGFEARRASESAPPAASFQVMRAIGARDFTPNDLAAEWCALRRYMVRALRGLPQGEWISWQDFRRLLFDFYPDVVWALFSPDHWWFSAPGRAHKLNPTREEEWQHTIGAILEVILAEPLKWFGAIETDSSAPSQDGKGLRSFRLTDIHAWLNQVQPLAQAAEPTERPGLPFSATPHRRQAEPVTWLSDRQWRLPPAPDRAEFITFARKVAEPGDIPFTYVLTPASIERALSQGIGADEIAQQFEDFGAPLPTAARALCASIAERFGRVRIYESLTLLQLADDYALRELLANTSLAQHIVYQISPRAVAVREEAVDALVKEMIARGYTPTVK